MCEIKERIYMKKSPAYEDKNTGRHPARENAHSQTDFHANCYFQRARGRGELVSCKQEH